MPSVVFSYCYAECCYGQCHYAECRYAECRYAECLSVVAPSSSLQNHIIIR
jgi:hypothetical protein